MKTSSPFIKTLLAPVYSAVTLAFCMSFAAADSDLWNIDEAGNWTTADRWLLNDTARIPGVAGAGSADIATFSFTLTADRTVTVDTDRHIGGIEFGNTSAKKHTLSGGNILLSNGGVIRTLAGNGNHQDTISSPIKIDGGDGAAASFTANATSATSLLTIGAVTANNTTAAGVTTLTLNGTNAATGVTNNANNSITGVIGNGASGKLALVKDGPGNWILGASNTFTGGLTIKAGNLTLLLNSSSNNSYGPTLLGDTAGSSNATLTFYNGGFTWGLNNAVTVQAGSSGLKTIRINPATSGTANTIHAPFTLNDNLTISNSNTNASGTTFSTTATFSIASGKILTISQPASARTVNFNGVISGDGGVTLDGGVANLKAVNSYGGDTTVSAGTLSLGDGTNNTALSNTANVIVGATATLNLNYPSGSSDTVNKLIIAGSPKAPGIWGSATSGAPNTDTRLTGSGTITVTTGNSLPTITDIADQYIAADTATGALAFTVSDVETPAASLQVTKSSSNTTLVPNENIVFGGSGANRTVTVTPATGQSGTATITVTVSDGTDTASDTFLLTVTASNNYASWAGSQLPPVTGGVNGDSDNDGVLNLVEYALIDGGERGGLSGNTITFTKRGAPYGTDISYAIEVSTDLGVTDSWHVPGSGVTDNPSIISYTFTPGSPVRNFARLKVNEN
jgi:autotransporter-associated beta strand protein